jgi:outer membrane protein OmpA-like peptidoglycan-associated protein/peptidoglycan hydrolase-like protein with peptidoglycan-binding domain
MRSRLVTSTLFAAALAGAALPAGAQGFIEIGGFGTAARFDPVFPYGTLNSGGARLTLASGSGLATFMLEGDASYYKYSFGPSIGEMQMIPVHVRYNYAPQFGPLSVILGVGGVRNQFTSKSTVSATMRDLGYSGLVGLRYAPGSFMSVRVDGVLDYITHPISGAAQRNTNRMVQAGISFPLWIGHAKEKPAPAPVAPPVAAPTPAPTPVAAAPAPDADGDGIPDARDQCANTSANSSVDGAGCPVYYDSDNDGVVDPKDLCPTTRPGAAVDGHGCALAADSDNDGVPDDRDRCPGTAAGTPVNSVGCAAPVAEADADKDGVPDSRDKCPASPAGSAVDSVGCPAPLFKPNERTVTLRGVNFEPSKEDLLQSSMQILDEVARQLNASPEIKVEVAGHTDSNGKYTTNVRLSVARAEAVRAYLIMRGVNADRLVARGYGPDQPITSNKSVSGRAMNRRVELKRID